jgi:hypothetical protein
MLIRMPMIVLLTLFLTGVTAVAQAQRGEGPDPMTFAEADQNGDGTLTEEEYLEARAERLANRAQAGYRMRMVSQAPDFSDLDLDGDGEVGPEEFARAQARHRAQRRDARGSLGPTPAAPSNLRILIPATGRAHTADGT